MSLFHKSQDVFRNTRRWREREGKRTDFSIVAVQTSKNVLEITVLNSKIKKNGLSLRSELVSVILFKK